MVGLADFIGVAGQVGIFEFYLPFLLVLTIFYAILNKVKIFGDPEKRGPRSINLLVALIAAFYVMSTPIVGGFIISFTTLFSTFFTQAALAIITIIVFLMILYLIFPALTGKEGPQAMGGGRYVIGLVALLIIVALLFSSGLFAAFTGPTQIFLPFIALTTQDMIIIGLVVITALVILAVVREPGKRVSKEEYETVQELRKRAERERRREG